MNLISYSAMIGSFLFFNVFSVDGATETDIIRLRNQLKRNYDPLVRPVQNHKDTVQVDVHFLNNGNMQFDEVKGVMTLHLLTAMSWLDEHLKWDPLNYGNLTELTFSPSELWKPDLTLINNYDMSEIDHFANTLMIATSDSFVWWIPPTKFEVSCPTDYTLWPYDKQRCSFQVSSWSYQGDEVNLTIPENYTKLVVEDEWQEHLVWNREWDLVYSIVKRVNQTAQYCCPRIDYVDIFIGTEIKRRANSHTAAVTVVGLGITVAILISFWLNPFSNERIPVTLLLLLINSIYLQYMYKTIPNNGASVPLTICFFRDSLVMTTFAFTWTVMIRYIAKTKRYSKVPLPNFVETLLSSFLASCLCLNPRPSSKAEIQRKNMEGSQTEGEVGDGEELVEGNDADSIRSDWEWLARLLDRVAFFAYLFTYIIFITAFLY